MSTETYSFVISASTESLPNLMHMKCVKLLKQLLYMKYIEVCLSNPLLGLGGLGTGNSHLFIIILTGQYP